jgi:hypothetical protein
MKMNKSIFAAAAFLALVACSENKAPAPAPAPPPAPATPTPAPPPAPTPAPEANKGAEPSKDTMKAPDATKEAKKEEKKQ